MGKFEEVSTGDGILKLNGIDAGFIRNVNFSVTSEELELWNGSPEQFEGADAARGNPDLRDAGVVNAQLRSSIGPGRADSTR